MSTENEAGSVPAAESAETASSGAAPDAASEAQAPAPPAAPPAPADDVARTEVLPAQAPPPVGPPSPYGPPPAALAHQAAAQAQPQPPAQVPPVPAPAPVPAAPAVPAAPSPYPYEQAGGHYELQKPQAQDAPPVPVAPRPAVEDAPPAAQAHPQPAPQQSPYQQPSVVPAQPQPAYGPHATFAAESPQNAPQDPYAVPATPAYAVGGQPPQTQHGYGGSGGPEGPVWGSPAPVPPDGGRKRRGFGGLVAAVLVAALVAGGVGGGIGYWAAEHNDKDSSASTTVSDTGSQKALNRAPTSVAGIANKALPRVVTIKASGSQESGTGTGFVYDKQGHILTNNHVVAPAADGGKLTVTFSNGKTYDAEVIGRAQGYDVAVIKLKNASGVDLSPLPLGNSDNTAVGDTTIAIGAPFGLSGTVTTGIVSAMHRPVASSDGQGSQASYMSAIQTDASINPGNSGGPLLNADGAVIGINSAIQPGASQPGTQGGSVGLGFAIPINQAKRVADELIKTGQPVYPVMKVEVDGQYQGNGAKIGGNGVTPGGPGDAAGLKDGDVITQFDHTIIDSSETLIAEIWQHKPGDKVSITYTRDGSSHSTTVTLGKRVGDAQQ